MTKKALDLGCEDVLKFSFFLSNGQAMLITCLSTDEMVRGIMAVSWVSPTSHHPLQMMASIGNGPPESGAFAYRYCYSIVKESREYGVNVPTAALAEATGRIGFSHSNEVDKFELTGLTPMKAKYIKCPLIQECPVNVECAVTEEVVTGDHSVFVADVKAIWYDEDVFVDGRFSDTSRDKNNQIHHIDLLGEMM